MDERLRRSAAHVVVADLDQPVLDEGDAHHLVRVLRLRDGAAITVTDGGGRWRPARLVGSLIEPDGAVVVVPEASPPVTIAVAPPKGDRLDWLVQKVTELGVDELVLLDADRSVVRWSGERVGKQMERLRRIAREAAMQSRRVRLPVVRGPVPARHVLGAMAVAEPGGRPLRSGDHAVAVGPEGGWSPDELAVARDRVSLGELVLRVETATAVAAALMHDRRRTS